MKVKTVVTGMALLTVALSSSGCGRAQTEPDPGSSDIAQMQMAYVVNDNFEIWITDLSLNDPHIIPVEGGARSLGWSPGGRYLAWTVYDYQTHQSSIWVVDTVDDTVEQVVPWTESLLGPMWSPDGRMLRVAEFAADGEELVYVLSTGTWNRASVWFETFLSQTFRNIATSPDWQYVAYLLPDSSTLTVCDRDGNTWNIFDLRPGVHGFESLVWSADSQQLAFSASGADYQINVFISRFDGEGLRQMTSGPGTRGVLSWAPSGDYLAFDLIDSEDGNQICYINTENPVTSLHCLKGMHAGGRLHWLSDDEWLLSTNRVDGHWDIYRVSLADEVFTNLTQDEETESGLVIWLPQ